MKCWISKRQARGYVFTDGRFIGRIADPTFSRVVLSTFIGPQSLLPDVRAGLLGQH